MPPDAIALALTAAVLHAGWNLIAKASRDGPRFYWLAALATAVIYAPAFAVAVSVHGIPASGLGWIVASAAVNAVYFVALSQAYARAGISVAYPISRGIGPVVVLLVTVGVLGESVTWAGALGVLIVVMGIYGVRLSSWRRAAWMEPLRGLTGAGGRYAVLTGLLIAAYTLIDRQGVREVHPTVFVYLEFTLGGLLLTPFVRPWQTLRSAVQSRDRAWRAIAVGVVWVAAYFLVLLAFQRAPLAYVAATREISIVLATALGALVLREHVTRSQFVAAIAITAGVVLIAVA